MSSPISTAWTTMHPYANCKGPPSCGLLAVKGPFSSSNIFATCKRARCLALSGSHRTEDHRLNALLLIKDTAPIPRPWALRHKKLRKPPCCASLRRLYLSWGAIACGAWGKI